MKPRPQKLIYIRGLLLVLEMFQTMLFVQVPAPKLLVVIWISIYGCGSIFCETFCRAGQLIDFATASGPSPALAAGCIGREVTKELDSKVSKYLTMLSIPMSLYFSKSLQSPSLAICLSLELGVFDSLFSFFSHDDGDILIAFVSFFVILTLSVSGVFLFMPDRFPRI